MVAMKRVGGSATNAEIMDMVARDLSLNDQQRALRRTPKGSRSLLDYRLAWSRTLLKNMGAIVNDGPCHWSVTEAGGDITREDVEIYVKKMLDRLQENLRSGGVR
jgi:restriction system protein